MTLNTAAVRKLTLISLLFVGGFAVAYAWRVKGNGAHTDTRRPADTLTGQDQLVMVYVGSATCAWCNHPAIPGLLRTIRGHLLAKADTMGWQLVTVGVAANWDVNEGIRHLRRLGPFDEVSAGMSWLNSIAIRYFWRDIPGQAATPELLVLARPVDKPDTAQVAGTFEVGDEILLVRKIGLPELQTWAAAGAPVPGVAPMIELEARRRSGRATLGPRAPVF